MNENIDEKSIMAVPMDVYNSPTLEDITGTARTFAEETRESMQNEEMFNVMGVSNDKTFLAYGKPGTGKTFSISALNNTMNSKLRERLKRNPNKAEHKLTTKDFGLLVFPYDIGRFGTCYINVGSRYVQSFFDQVMFYASTGTKTLVMLDEADALLSARGESGQHGEDRKVLETIMKNMQEAHDTPNLYVVLITNMPEICDDAALRAGRIDRKYEFKLPTIEERIKAYELFRDKINKRAGYSVVRGMEPEQLAELSEGFNYADVEESVQAAVKQRVREISRDKTKGIMPAGYVTQKRLLEATRNHATNFKGKEKSKIGFAL